MKITCTRKILVAIKAIVLLAVSFGVGPAWAIDYTWDKGGGDSNWSTAANWNPDGTPGAGDNVIFNGTSNTACTADNVADNLGSISLNAGYTQTLTLNSNFVGGASNTLTLTGNLTVNSGNLLCKGDVTVINAASGGDAGNPHGTGIVINAANVTVASGAKIHADSQGFAATTGPGQGNDQAGAGGGGYGGYGGQCIVPGGVRYGSLTQPTALGSGGGQF